MAQESGFIKLSRKYFDHPFFTEKREYSKAEAWLDLIQICAYEEGNSMLWKGKVIVWGRGQIVASVRYLQQRWNWKSVDKVFSFLELLRSQNMIKTDSEQGIGRITLCKYDDYNDTQNAKRTQNRTHIEQSPNEIKEDKEYKEIKNNSSADAPQKFKSLSYSDFRDTVFENTNLYGSEMLEDFVRYWAEKNQKGVMKFQLQKTWETGLRLETWRRNQKKFSNGKSDKPTTASTIDGIDAAAAELIRDIDEAAGRNTAG